MRVSGGSLVSTFAVGVLVVAVVVVVDGFPLAPRRTFRSSSRTWLQADGTDPTTTGRRRSSRAPRDRTTSEGPTTKLPPRERRPIKKVEPFDGKALTAEQSPNEDAPPLDLEALLESSSLSSSSSSSPLRCLAEGALKFQNEIKDHPPFRFHSLNDLFGADLQLSETFNQDSQFRQELRMAIREDIFDTPPYYERLSEKARGLLLLSDSSLEGSWRMPETTMDRMKRTTDLLRATLGDQAPTGDELINAIGNLCGSKPSTHFIDIFGVQDRKINHSWHLDAGRSPEEDSRTVLWGFPPEDNYSGCGVFSHIVPLQRECFAPEGHPRNEPVLFAGTLVDDSESIVRPRYQPGRELISYRDVDVLHSAPDVTYRMSIMRFM